MDCLTMRCNKPSSSWTLIATISSTINISNFPEIDSTYDKLQHLDINYSDIHRTNLKAFIYNMVIVPYTVPSQKNYSDTGITAINSQAREGYL